MRHPPFFSRGGILCFIYLCFFFLFLFFSFQTYFHISNTQISTDSVIRFDLQPSLCHNMVSRCKLHVWRTESCVYIVLWQLYYLFIFILNWQTLEMKSPCKHSRFFFFWCHWDRFRHLGKLWPSLSFFIILWQRWGGSRPISQILQIHRLTSILSILPELEKTVPLWHHKGHW